MSKFIDLTGQRFGKWQVLKRVSNDKDEKARWFCRCDCGREKIVYGQNLRNVMSPQCRHCAPTIHGLSGTRLYIIWRGMIQRCENLNDKYYKRWGGRGIKVCPEWHDAATFLKWALKHGYDDKLQIDRINNDGNYEPENCRFATRKEQMRNGRHNRLVKIGAEIKTLVEWAEQARINYHTLKSRLNNGWPEHRLLNPVKSC